MFKWYRNYLWNKEDCPISRKRDMVIEAARKNYFNGYHVSSENDFSILNAVIKDVYDCKPPYIVAPGEYVFVTKNWNFPKKGFVLKFQDIGGIVPFYNFFIKRPKEIRTVAPSISFVLLFNMKKCLRFEIDMEKEGGHIIFLKDYKSPEDVVEALNTIRNNVNEGK